MEQTSEGVEPVDTNYISTKWVNEHQMLRLVDRGYHIHQFADRILAKNIPVQFRVLRRLTESTQHVQRLFKGSEQFSFNRYNNIIPYESTRVPLNGPEAVNNYINANFIKTPIEGELVIATQGPLSSTVEHFWRMVEQYNIQHIFMLCQLEEGTKVQCFRYWPDETDPNSTREFPNFKVVFVSREEISSKLFKRTFKLINKQDEKEREIVQYQIKSWEDNQAPIEEIEDSLQTLIEIATDSLISKKKTVVHCSAGVGRTGTFLTLVNLALEIKLIKESKPDNTISVFRVVRELREQRWGMVAKPDQYSFIYEFIKKQLS